MTGISFFFNVQDGKTPPQTSTIEIPFPNTTPVSVFVAGVDAIGQLIHPLVTGGLKSAGVKITIDVPTWGPTAINTADVQEKMEFGVRASNGFLKRLNIPTIDESMFIPGSTEGDTSEAALLAFNDFLEDGITVGGTLIQPSDSHGSDLLQVEYRTENWGKRRRR
jgi:hypothetical protein